MDKYDYPQMMTFSEMIFAKKILIFLSPTRKFLILSVVCKDRRVENF